MLAESKPTTEYHKVRKWQSAIIRKNLKYLAEKGVDHNFPEVMTPEREYEAWQFTKKHWRVLKGGGVEWIKAGQYLSHYELRDFDDDGGIVVNLSKNESHHLTWEVDSLICDCEGFEYSGHCSHVEFALENLPDEPGVEISANATVTIDDSAKRSLFNLVDSSLPPQYRVNAPSKEWVDDALDPRVAMLEVMGDEVSAPLSTKEILPGVVGTADQLKALPEMVEFAKGSKAIHGLFGVAGSGKSTLLQAMIQALRNDDYRGRIVFTAPTNKAVAVLQSMVGRWDLQIECQTCARLLGLKLRIDPQTGDEYFEPDSKRSSTISNYQLVVIDECSMVSSTNRHKGLWEYLVESASFFTKLLFVGDHCQLPPVNEAISKVFLTVQEPSWLTEVKRYDGAVAAIADQVRQNLSRQSRPRFGTDISSDKQKGFFVLSREKWHNDLIRAFSSDNYLLDPNHVRALAYTNKRVHDLNRHIRGHLHSKDSPRFVVGDRLIAKRPYFREHYGDFEGFATSAEMEVTEAYEGTEGDYCCWFLTVQMLDATGQCIVFPVIHEKSQGRFRDVQNKLKSQGQYLAYHANLEHWAWVDYAYALTVHSSQGSTFKDVFVDNKNIHRDKQHNIFEWPSGRKELIWERNQLLYVALTRASHRVFIYE